MAAAGTLAFAVGGDAKKRRKKKCKKTTCKPLLNGQVCESIKACCGNETDMSCDVPNGGTGIETVCCGVANAPCSVDGDCCEGWICALSTMCILP